MRSLLEYLRSPDSSSLRRWVADVTFAVGVALALWTLYRHASAQLPYIEDDALISLRYSERLLQGKGLTWTDGEWVEGYSNFLWVVATAGVASLGFDLVDSLRVLGYSCFVATVLAIAWRYAPRGGIGPFPAVIGGFAVACSGNFAAWAVGGLEQPLVAALLVWGIVTAYPLLYVERLGLRDVWLPGTLLGLTCLTRADALVLVGAVGLGFVLARGWRLRTLQLGLLLGLLPGLFVVTHLAFRLGYYGEWVPNTAHAKVAWTSERIEVGWQFLSEAIRWALPLVLVAGCAAAASVLAPRQAGARRIRWLLVPLVLWCLYVVSVGGGDTMPARRHVVPAHALLALLVAEAAAWAVRAGWAARLTLIPAMVAAVFQFWFLQHEDNRNVIVPGAGWAWRGEPVGNLLRIGFHEQQPLFAVDAAGCGPFFSKLPALDMLGLNDRYIAQHPPPEFGKGKIGHELGDGKYVLSREPDLIEFCSPGNRGTPCWRSGREMRADPSFHQRYRLVRFEGTDPERVVTSMWVRLEGRIGLARRDDRLTVPGYLFATRQTTAILFGSDVVAHLKGGRAGRLERLPLEAGSWRLRAERSGAAVELTVRRGGAVLASGPPPLELSLPRTTTVDIQVAARRGSEAYLKRVDIERRSRGSQ